MRKLISIALVIVMVLSFAVVVVSAEVSPDKYFQVVVGSEGSGNASNDKSEVLAGDNSDYVTLTATEDGGYFTKWIMTGSYTAISGDEYSDVFVIRPESHITAIASFSKEKEMLTISGETVGNGKITINPQTVAKNSGEAVTLTATPDPDEEFVTWNLACDYDIVSGDMTSETMVIIPYTDVLVTGVFTENGQTPAQYEDGDSDSSDTSPKTGDPTLAVLVIVLMASFAGAFAVKKIRES